VTNDRPGMAPSDIDSLKQKADELDQQLEKLTDKMEEIITARIFFSNVAMLCCACIKLSCACSTSFLILITLAFQKKPQNKPSKKNKRNKQKPATKSNKDKPKTKRQ
jgi:hypothetical protein